MQFLGVFIAILTACLATGLLLAEEEERAVVQGSHCDYIMFVLSFKIIDYQSVKVKVLLPTFITNCYSEILRQF